MIHRLKSLKPVELGVKGLINQQGQEQTINFQNDLEYDTQNKSWISLDGLTGTQA